MSRTEQLLKILLIDDSESDRLMYSRQISKIANKNVIIDEGDSGESMIQLLDEKHPDCIILDYHLPDYTALELLSLMKGRLEITDTAVLVITGDSNQEKAFKTVEIGAYDYLIKGEISAERLWLSVHNAVEKNKLLKMVKQHNASLKKMAYYDALTNVYNRSAFIHIFEQSISAALRHECMLCLLYCDLDCFKSVNDTLGHEVGDLLLIEVVSRIQEVIRLEDSLGRMGGDEFAVLLVQIQSEEDAAIIAKKILETLSRPFNIQSNHICITASIGIATFPTAGACHTKLFRSADAAMYKAKSLGKNTYHFYTHQLNMQALKTEVLEGALKEAVLPDDFFIDFNPCFNVKSGELSAVKSRMRWRTNKFGEVHSKELFVLAKKLKIFESLSQWYLQQTVHHYCKNFDSLERDKTVLKIEMFSGLLMSPDFIASFTQLLGDAALSPQHIYLEIDIKHISEDEHIKALQKLTDLGFQCVLFGLERELFSLKLLNALSFLAISISSESCTDQDKYLRFIQLFSHHFNAKVVVESEISKDIQHKIDSIEMDELQLMTCSSDCYGSDLHLTRLREYRLSDYLADATGESEK